MKAIWNNKVIAESSDTITVEGNQYFPHSAIKKEYFKDSSSHTSCHWKGVASYYNIEVDGKVYKDGAWYYPDTSELASSIKNYVAFYGNVEIVN